MVAYDPAFIAQLNRELEEARERIQKHGAWTIADLPPPKRTF